MSNMKHIEISNSQLTSYIRKICRDITVVDRWYPDYIIGIVRGGCIPAIMISHFLDIPCEMLKISLRGVPDTETNCWMAEDAINGKNILIVDDINDTGATLEWLVKDWQSSVMSPDWHLIWNNSVRFATIVDNENSELSSVIIDYSAMNINKAEEDVWIDFPWETWHVA